MSLDTWRKVLKTIKWLFGKVKYSLKSVSLLTISKIRLYLGNYNYNDSVYLIALSLFHCQACTMNPTVWSFSNRRTVALPYCVQTFKRILLTGWCFGGGVGFFPLSRHLLFLFFPLHLLLLFPCLFLLPAFFPFTGLLLSPSPSAASLCIGPNSIPCLSLISFTVVFRSNLQISSRAVGRLYWTST